MDPFFKSATFLFLLLNPFTMSVYLVDLLKDLDRGTFLRVLSRGSLIATVTFILVALAGDRFFDQVLQARFASFLFFGGVVFLLVALRIVFNGGSALEGVRGPPERLAGAVAMPFMIGPGTVSAAILAGGRLPPGRAVGAIVAAMVAAVLCLACVKVMFDAVRRRYEGLATRYLDTMGRLSALLIGTWAVEMMFQGIELWLGKLLPGSGS